VVASLAEARGGAVDGWAGDLSYPVYLLHTTVGAWFLPVFGAGRSFGFFCAAMVVTLFLSWLMVAKLEIPLRVLKLGRGMVPRAPPGRAAVGAGYAEATALGRTLPLVPGAQADQQEPVLRAGS
jgi:peptidoglycan/LPS O-acetylase OafA/YrhL